MEEIDCLVVGAGLVGLAVARSLAEAGREVMVADAGEVVGSGASSRNSEVIHAGIYYPAEWLKTRLCVAGREALYAYCEARSVPYRRLGKVVVAIDESERAVLDRLLAQAERNGVAGVSRLSPRELAERVPGVRAVDGLFSRDSGILDGHQLMLALEADIEAAGGMVALGSRVAGGRLLGGESGLAAEVRFAGEEAFAVRCRTLVNAAGLGAQALAEALGVPAEHVPRLYLARGQYYTLSGPHPFRHLVYPVPVAGGLGVHVTLDLAGQVRFGPDVHWINAEDYGFDATAIPGVAEAVRRYWPALEPERLAPGYTGIRAKLSGPGEPARDFVIEGPAQHGVPGLVNLYGIESPGLTACLAIGDHVERVLAGA